MLCYREWAYITKCVCSVCLWSKYRQHQYTACLWDRRLYKQMDVTTLPSSGTFVPQLYSFTTTYWSTALRGFTKTTVLSLRTGHISDGNPLMTSSISEIISIMNCAACQAYILLQVQTVQPVIWWWCFHVEPDKQLSVSSWLVLMNSSVGALFALLIAKPFICGSGSLHSELEWQEQVHGIEREFSCLV